MKKDKELIDVSKLLGKKRLLKLLFRILKGHKCYVSFKRNIAPSELKTIVRKNAIYYDDFGNLDCIAEIINNAFTWEDTQEGHKFWSNIYERLRDYESMPKTLTYKQFKLIFTND